MTEFATIAVGLFFLVLFLIIVFSVVGIASRSRTANQLMFEMMSPEQQDRVIDRRRKAWFIRMAAIVALIIWWTSTHS